MNGHTVDNTILMTDEEGEWRLLRLATDGHIALPVNGSFTAPKAEQAFRKYLDDGRLRLLDIAFGENGVIFRIFKVSDEALSRAAQLAILYKHKQN